MPQKATSVNRTVLYKKNFSFSRNLTPSSYIKALSKESFLPFLLYVEETSVKNLFRLKFEFGIPFARIIYPFSNWIFLAEGTIKYSKMKNEITVEASISTGLLFFHILILFSYIALIIWSIISAHFTLDGFFPMLLFVIVFASIYNRDIKRYNSIGLIATKLSKKDKRKSSCPTSPYKPVTTKCSTTASATAD